MKVRKQLHGKNRGEGPGESGSGSDFNPFKSVGDDLDGNSCVSNVGFVFGANGGVKSGDFDQGLNSRVELDSKETGFGGNVGQWSEKEPALGLKVEPTELCNMGFVFDANGNGVGVKSDVENRELNECVVNVGGVEIEKVSYAGDSEFCDDKSELRSSLNSNKGDSSGNGVNWVLMMLVLCLVLLVRLSVQMWGLLVLVLYFVLMLMIPLQMLRFLVLVLYSVLILMILVQMWGFLVQGLCLVQVGLIRS